MNLREGVGALYLKIVEYSEEQQLTLVCHILLAKCY
jgi:hypothetical protein